LFSDKEVQAGLEDSEVARLEDTNHDAFSHIIIEVLRSVEKLFVLD
jgi:hypothetical protein